MNLGFTSIGSIDKSASPFRVRPSSPGKIRGAGGESRDMTLEEMKNRYKNISEGIQHSNLEGNLASNVNTYGSWSNREEEWFFNNKRFLFSTKSADIRDEWVDKLNSLVIDP
jgi:hypothetical protein